MRAAGEIEAASANPNDLPEPLVLASRIESPSMVLRRLRCDERCDLLRVNDRILTLVGALLPHEPHSLDAIHLATAERLRGEIGELITYDDRMADAARSLGHRVTAPA